MDEDDEHDGVPGQALKAGHTVCFSIEENVVKDHSLLDGDEGPQQVKHLSLIRLSGNLTNVIFNLIFIGNIYLATSSK